MCSHSKFRKQIKDFLKVNATILTNYFNSKCSRTYSVKRNGFECMLKLLKGMHLNVCCKFNIQYFLLNNCNVLLHNMIASKQFF